MSGPCVDEVKRTSQNEGSPVQQPFSHALQFCFSESHSADNHCIPEACEPTLMLAWSSALTMECPACPLQLLM